MKPCPFCLGTPNVTSQRFHGSWRFEIECGICGATGPSFVRRDESECREAAVNAWDERPEATPLAIDAASQATATPEPAP